MPRQNKIILRNGTAAPSPGDFDMGEPAWDKTAGRLYVKDDAGSMVQIGGELGNDAILNRYYLPWGMGPGTAGTRVVTASRVYYYLFFNSRRTTWTRIGSRVATGGAGTARMGLYAAGSTGLPTTLLQDFGTFSTSTSGLKEITISYDMTPGPYYIALVTSAAITYSGYFHDLDFTAYSYGISSTTNTVGTSLWFEGSSGDVLPSTANTTLTEEDTSLRRPIVHLRKA
jgi:hypothetical protein